MAGAYARSLGTELPIVELTPMRSHCACALPSRDVCSMPAAPPSKASARGNRARPLSSSCVDACRRGRAGAATSKRFSSFTAELGGRSRQCDLGAGSRSAVPSAEDATAGSKTRINRALFRSLQPFPECRRRCAADGVTEKFFARCGINRLPAPSALVSGPHGPFSCTSPIVHLRPSLYRSPSCSRPSPLPPWPSPPP